ncbi:hypothetical protein B0H17DRAFT_1329112 [Mycena rosella]|uniref:Uncharacterized protein n=1 Tax=Mycena rosella TaxID=1033263 RepID=A0AAD7DQQ5_MYCRO|nr:hypothetical protein B0H17DRAFT_1329112 [Mycena rosella]
MQTFGIVTPTLGLLHLRLKAWSGLSSSLSANWLYSRSHSKLPNSPGLKTILLYLGFCTLLQVSSGSIFAIIFDVNTSDTLLDLVYPVEFGSRFGNFDELYNRPTSSSDALLFPPATRNAAVNMFGARTNDTRYPGLHGRLLHDTVNLDDFVAEELAWTKARVNATLVNVHCSQISNATINTFTLPSGSTDMSLAQPSPRNGQERAYWGDSGFIKLPTRVFFQPWAFNFSTYRGPMGHHQVVMVVATGNPRAVLVDSANSTGNSLNLTMFQVPDSDGNNGGQAYIQILGCTVRNDNLTATINPLSRLLDPPTSRSKLIGPEAPHDDHAWDEFEWEGFTDVTATERQFLLAFTPSSPTYNNTATDAPNTPPGDAQSVLPEAVLGNLLDGEESSPFLTAQNALVNFQGSLERLYASYLWNDVAFTQTLIPCLLRQNSWRLSLGLA